LIYNEFHYQENKEVKCYLVGAFTHDNSSSNCLAASSLVIVGKVVPVVIAAVSTTEVFVHEVEFDHELVSVDHLVDKYITEVNAEASKKMARIIIMRNFKIFLCVVM